MEREMQIFRKIFTILHEFFPKNLWACLLYRFRYEELKLKRQTDMIGKQGNVLISLYFIFNDFQNSRDFHITRFNGVLLTGPICINQLWNW